VTLLHGDVAGKANSDQEPLILSTYLVGTMIEVLEHIELDSHTQLFTNIFGHLRPNLFIMSTPNIDFNKFFKPFRKKATTSLGCGIV
jgi:2-polyprenyl-3-methyl-5-hydroxy-6-metoxy-1,4-benzoquinol methylase